MIKCTFAGHRDVMDIHESDIENILENILLQTEEIECLVGGMGNFDRICASAVRNLKKKYKKTGGAYKTWMYAQKKEIKIINIEKESEGIS